MIQKFMKGASDFSQRMGHERVISQTRQGVDF